MTLPACLGCNRPRTAVRQMVTFNAESPQTLCDTCIAFAVFITAMQFKEMHGGSYVDLAWRRASQMLASFMRLDVLQTALLFSVSDPTVLRRQISNDNYIGNGNGHAS